MKSFKSFVKILMALSVLSVLVTGCGNEVSNSNDNIEYGSLSVFQEKDRAIASGDIKSAVVTVSGYNANGVFYQKSSSVVAVSSGSASGIKIEQIPVSLNAVVKVLSYTDAEGKVPYSGVNLYAKTNITSGENSVTVNWNTSKAGIVYSALIDASVNTNTLTSTQISSISTATPDVHAYLINSSALAADFKSNSLKASSNYVLSTGTVKVTASGLNGYSVRITDAASETNDINSASKDFSFTSIPGHWKIQVLSSSGDVEKEADILVASGYATTVTINKTTAVTDKIIVKVKTDNSNGYTGIWAWKGSTNYTASKKWPGDDLTDSDGDGYYDYTINALSSDVILNIPNGSSASKQTETISITEPGIFVFNDTAFVKESGNGEITIKIVEPDVPVSPAIAISPAGGEIKTKTKIQVSLDNGKDTITNAQVKVTGTGINRTFAYSDFTDNKLVLIPEELGIAAEKSFVVSGSVTNSVGTVSLSPVTFTTVESVVSSGDWNNLSIYQVMVSSFIDGDKSIGYSYAYGPSNTYDYNTGSNNATLKGGDLQGIIDAADYISDLGVNAIWMTPIFDSSSGENNEYLNSTGYFAYDFFTVDPKFGTNEKFAELVETYHNKGIYVILDGVFGHWNGAGIKASPTGKTATRSHGQYKAADYPASLEFFKEVAQYWIKNYKIDGWRFDQCYQVGNGDKSVGDNSYTNDHNYWYEIRTAIKEAAEDNANKGEQWGTLGYTVGEHWEGDAAMIQRGSVAPGTNGAGYGLQSCFDFPSRYRLVQTMAREEGTNSGTDYGAAMEYTYGTFEEKGYDHPEGYYPNLFFTNHDLVRYGNLLNWKFSIDPTSDEYYTRHKLMLAVLAGYTGPITTYYGDEWGAYVKGYSGPGSLGAYNDNMARSTGKISGFTAKESALIEYYKKLMAARNSHPAMWNGTATKVKSTTTSYVVKKTVAGETIYICFNNDTSSTSFSASGTDLITGATYSGTVSVPPLSAVFVLAK